METLNLRINIKATFPCTSNVYSYIIYPHNLYLLLLHLSRSNLIVGASAPGSPSGACFVGVSTKLQVSLSSDWSHPADPSLDLLDGPI